MAKKQFARTCSECGKGMNEGYIIGDGIEHYCSDACMYLNMTPAEYLELHADGEGDSYWTDWSEDPDNFDDEEDIEIKLDIEDIDEPLYDALLAAFRAKAKAQGLDPDACMFGEWVVSSIVEDKV